MPEPEPTLDEWRRLYAAAAAYFELAPWRRVWDDEEFGVRDPEGHEIGYCCVMGRLGEHYALGVYLGVPGLRALHQLRTIQNVEKYDPLDIMLEQDCLTASFEDRAGLKNQDLETIRVLGLKFRGRQDWPRFRRYKPGCQPWFLTGPEARFLTTALEQAVQVCARLLDGSLDLPDREPDGEHLVRMPEKSDDGWEWRDTYARPAPTPPETITPPAVDPVRLRGLRDRLPQAKEATFELDWFWMPTVILDAPDGRPYFANVILATDADSGMILGADTAQAGERDAHLVDVLLGIVEQNGVRPARVRVRRERTHALLAPVGKALGIRVTRVQRLEAVEPALAQMRAFLRSG